MIVSIENQGLVEKAVLDGGVFSINVEDPAYVRSDMIIVHGSNREVGVVFSEGYHTLGVMPQNIALDELLEIQEAFLKAVRADGSVLKLSAPLCVNLGE